MVLHLHPISEGSSLVSQTLVNSSETRAMYQFGDPYCTASEKFVVIASGRELTIVDSDEKRIVKLQFSILDYCFGRVQIWDDHLFFIGHNRDGKVNMYAFSLVQAMAAPCNPLTVTEADPSLISSFDPMEYANGESARTSDLANAAFSLYDHSYSNEANHVTISIVGPMWNYSLLLTDPDPPPEYLFSRVIFNKDQRKWMHVRTSISDIPVDNNTSKPWVARRTGLSRSGRRLMSFVSRDGPKERNSIVAVDSEGNIIFPRISENIAFMSPEKNGGNLLHDYIEPYSGTLIRLKDRQSGKAVIELYRPA
ncbi:hypothetical protein A7U60_g6296 [Sanghuangporus baumii]|uniref:Uncharacterized protein n=1 Tax=Sanghuangporus baumii TaxID=108892 RepID=A0A9Q5HV70_SANBA|nr:hypothetical protein A7U60_g6296 [Sanghuangporus baumii]